MGEWLKDRGKALIDAALIYLVTEWIGPATVSAVVYLGLSDAGRALLCSIGYVLLMAAAIALAIKLEPPAPGPADDAWKLVYVWSRPSVPFGIGGHGRWIRIRVPK